MKLILLLRQVLSESLCKFMFYLCSVLLLYCYQVFSLTDMATQVTA